MGTEKEASDEYTRNMAAYIKKRDAIIQMAKKKCVDKSTMDRFKTSTDELLQRISDIYENDSKKNSFLANLLEATTLKNKNSLSQIEELLKEPSEKGFEQALKYKFNMHVEEISRDLPKPKEQAFPDRH